MMNEITPEQAKAERGDAQRLYLLSLWSPLMIAMSACFVLFAFIWILIFLIVIVVGFRSSHAFVRWHTGQWTLFTGLAALIVLANMLFLTGAYSRNTSFLDVIFLLVIVFVLGGWYVGNLIGFRQAKRGDCWLWKWCVPAAELPRPQPTPVVAPASPTPPQSARSTSPVTDPQIALLKGQTLISTGQRAEAAACFLTAFHDGSVDVRREAVMALEKLGEVETF